MADKALEAALLAAGPSHLPKAYGGCTCSCHRTPGIMHMTACCRPSEGEADFTITKEWFERKATLEDGCDVSVGTLSAPPSQEAPMVRLTKSQRAWLERLRSSGPTARGKSNTAYHCMIRGWTEWFVQFSDGRIERLEGQDTTSVVLWLDSLTPAGLQALEAHHEQ